MTKTILSLILCARNDRYMGNSNWRLQTTLNYVARKVRDLGREADVEILVTDWGSVIPLNEGLELSPEACRLTSFILIPSGMAQDLQKDSPFPEVLALNAAARRAGGEYIGRIDQDTLVGIRFLKVFFDLYEGREQIAGSKLKSALLFACRRKIPYRFVVREPHFNHVDRFIRFFGHRLEVEVKPWDPLCYSGNPKYYYGGVGIWLLHNQLWAECGGYDERMIYMNGMEVNMIHRLMQKYELKDLGRFVGYDFYHLEHYHPWMPRIAARTMNRNSEDFTKVSVMHPNKENWGLADYSLSVLSTIPAKNITQKKGASGELVEQVVFFSLVFVMAVQNLIDLIFVSVRKMTSSIRLALSK